MSNKEPLNIGLFGAPGSGKGTQAAYIVEEFNLFHLSTGDLLRAEIKNQTQLGLEAESIIKAGGLVKDEIIQGMIDAKVAEVLTVKNGLLLDGFPRTMPQAAFLDDCLARRETKLHAVFFLDIDNMKLLARLTGRRTCCSCTAVYHVLSMPSKVEGICDVCGGELLQRADDNEETIKGRLQAYEQQTSQVLRAYEERGILVRIDGDRDRELIQAEIAGKLRQIAQDVASA